MQSISNKIAERLDKRGRGYVFAPRDFIDLGTRQAIDTALSRLAAKGNIRRLCRGIYDFPKKHKMLGDLFPSLDQIANVIAHDSDSNIQISGARALHLLGLTTQVPAQVVYLTDGRSRKIKIGNAILMLKHTSPRIIAGAGSKAGTVLQAIRYLGKDHMTSTVITKITNQLDTQDRQSLSQLLRYAPGWSKSYLDQLIN